MHYTARCVALRFSPHCTPPPTSAVFCFRLAGKHALTKMRNKRCRHSGLKETAFVELSELLCLVQLE